MAKTTDNVVSVMIEGKGRFYAWGKTKADAERDLVLGLVSELEYALKAIERLKKSDLDMRVGLDKLFTITSAELRKALR